MNQSTKFACRTGAAVILMLLAAIGVAAAAQSPGVAAVAPAPMQLAALDNALQERVLAIDPENVTAADVRDLLSKVPAPRIVLLHGGVFPVHLAMSSFANFLTGMGYPEERIKVPGSDDWSHNPYLSSDRIAGLIAWSYEREGMRPMLIGHSQGGIQVVKVLYDLSGAFADRVPVWDPLTGSAESRTTIVDPLTGRERPVVGLSVSFASAIGAGGPSFIFPNNWQVLGRLREVPDSAVQFNGYFIGIDWFMFNFGGPGASRFRALGNTQVRNVELPAGYLHVSVPVTHHLPGNADFKAFIDSYRATSERPDEATMPGTYMDNVLYAADNWHGIKKHWALEAQRLIRARRASLTLK